MKVDVQTPCQDPSVLWAFEAAFDGRDGEAIDAAKSLCRSCLVQAECFQTAVATKSVGVWGGQLFAPKVYEPRGFCRRGHDVSGPNGRRRHNGSIACRVCEHNKWMAR